MDYTRRIHRVSNSYYNQGLQCARSRDLSGAVEMLKKSLHFNKYNTDARNLLGLIYCELGEITNALVQWVISQNLQPGSNRADKYLDKLQGRAGYIDHVDQAIKKYNQALLHAQSGSEDLAILQLTRAVEQNRNFVKAHLLLALLYIHQEEYTKAGKSVFQVQQIDKNNSRAQWYMTVVKEHTGRAEIEKRKLKNAFSHRQMQDDDIILPPSYKENTGIQTVINLIVGMVIGVMVNFFMVMPANNRILEAKHNRELITSQEALYQKNLELDNLEAELALAVVSQQEAVDSLNKFESENGDVLSQYQLLVQILDAYRREDLESAVQLYVKLNRDAVTDGVLNPVVEAVKADMETQGYPLLLGLADTAAAGTATDQAIGYYQQCQLIRPEDPRVLYQLGLMYKRKGETDTANEFFGQVIMNYGASEYAEPAKTERGY